MTQQGWLEFCKVGETSSSLIWVCGRMWDWHWLNVPDLAAIFRDGSIGRELSRLGNTFNSHSCPLFVVSVGCVNNSLSVDVSVKIEAGNVMISTIGQTVKDWVNNLSISEES